LAREQYLKRPRFRWGFCTREAPPSLRGAFPRSGISANRDIVPKRESSVFRVPFLVAISLIIAFGGGIASTLAALEATVGFGSIKIGTWDAFPRRRPSKQTLMRNRIAPMRASCFTALRKA